MIKLKASKREMGEKYDFIADFGYELSFDSYEEAKEEYENFSSLFENGIIPDDILEIC